MKGRVDHRRIQHLAGFIHNRNFASGAVGGIQAKRYHALHRRLHQQISQINGENADCLLARPLCQHAAHFAFQGRRDQPGKCVCCRSLHLFCAQTLISHICAR